MNNMILLWCQVNMRNSIHAKSWRRTRRVTASRVSGSIFRIQELRASSRERHHAHEVQSESVSPRAVSHMLHVAPVSCVFSYHIINPFMRGVESWSHEHANVILIAEKRVCAFNHHSDIGINLDVEPVQERTGLFKDQTRAAKNLGLGLHYLLTDIFYIETSYRLVGGLYSIVYYTYTPYILTDMI